MSKVKLKTPEERLSEIGRSVARQLSKPGKTQTVSEKELTLYFAQDFLTHTECEGLIALINKGRVKSGLLAVSDDPDYRTSDSCNLNAHDELVARIDARICTLMGINPRHGETLQGQVYEVGQQFKPHYDYFHKGTHYWDDMQAVGGQRCWTAMIYLNEPAAGGETEFPNAGLKVEPRTAMLLLWNNMLVNGTPNELTLHSGLPVLAGTKYVVTKWFRERFWG